jgi:hypothetical protein
MLEMTQPICYGDLCQALQEFVQGTTSLSTIKDVFSIFWNYTYDKGETNDEIIAKAEILHIAVEAYESGDFSIVDLNTTVQHCAK